MDGKPVVNKEIFEMDEFEPKDTKDAKKPRGRPFKKGRSGNPAGKAQGTRNSATLAAETLLEGECEGLTRILIEMAKGGNIAAMRLVMERVLPPRRERTLHFPLPPLKTAADAMTAMSMIAEGVGQGELSASEAHIMVSLVQEFLKGLEQFGNDLRMAKIEGYITKIEAKRAEEHALYVEKMTKSLRERGVTVE